MWDFSGMRRPISDHAKDLIRKLLVNDPNKRISLEDGLRHPWFTGSIEAVRVYERWCPEGVSAEVLSETSQPVSEVSPLGVQVLPPSNSQFSQTVAPPRSDSGTTDSFTNNQAIIQLSRVSPRAPPVPLLPKWL
jgi:serine/threonine protein kinase